MFRRLIAKFYTRKRREDAEAAWLAARARYTEARVRGDTRGQHSAYHDLVAARTAQLRMELGR